MVTAQHVFDFDPKRTVSSSGWQNQKTKKNKNTKLKARSGSKYQYRIKL